MNICMTNYVPVYFTERAKTECVKWTGCQFRPTDPNSGGRGEYYATLHNTAVRMQERESEREGTVYKDKIHLPILHRMVSYTYIYASYIHIDMDIKVNGGGGGRGRDGLVFLGS